MDPALVAPALVHQEVKLSSGGTSTYYIDARRLLAHPRAVAAAIGHWAAQVPDVPDVVVGVPEAGVPWATLLAQHWQRPLAMLRHAPKTTGPQAGQWVVGPFAAGQTCVAVEDVVTTGGSAARAVAQLEHAGLVVRAVVCVVQREPLARDLSGVPLIPAVWSCDLLPPRDRLAGLVRMKRSRLCWAADVTAERLWDLLPRLAPFLVMVKTHHDAYPFDRARLRDLCRAWHLLWFEDRKLVDIGAVAAAQAAALGGPDAVTTVGAVPLPDDAPLELIVTDLSHGAPVLSEAAVAAAQARAQSRPDRVLGVVSQRGRPAPDVWCFTPGVKLDGARRDPANQRYRTPREARTAGADVLIVGRGLSAAPNPVAAAERYRAASWEERKSAL